MKKIILLLCLLPFVVSLPATDWYFSTSGSDANNGLTPSSAKQTLSAAQTILDNASGDDQVLFKRGDTWTTRGGASTAYAGIVGIDLMNVDGSSHTSRITIGAYGTGSKPVFSFTGTGAAFQLTGCTYTNIQDIKIVGASSDITNRPTDAFHGIGSGGGYDVKFLRVDVDGTCQGYTVQDGNKYITWDGCDTRNTVGGTLIGGTVYRLTGGSGIFANVDSLRFLNCTWYNNGGGDSPADPGHEHSLYLSDCSNLLVENNTFYGSNDAMAIANGQHIVIRGNTIYDEDTWGILLTARSYGAYADLLDDVVVEKNLIHDSGIGIHLKTTLGLTSSVISNVIIRNNILYNDNSYSALFTELSHLITNLSIVNNTFYNNNIALRLATGATYDNVIIKNNIFYNNSTGTLLQIDNSSFLSNVSLDNNLYFSIIGNNIKVGGINYLLSGFQSVFSQELSAISGNPLFVNTVDFKISENSPAIDKGVALTNVTDDFDGNLRPAGNGYDIGAYEFGATTGPLPTSDTKLNIKILLEGPFNNGGMSTELSTEGDLPLNQPYNVAPWNYGGTESVSSIPSGVVDWVLLELRYGTGSSTIVSRRAGFVKSDGSVVDLDGVSKIGLSSLPNGNYYVVVIHRNHLPVMSANAVSLNTSSPLYDFTTSSSKAYGTDALADLGGGKWGLYAGDSDKNGTINVLDYGEVINFLFETGYKYGDLDLNGIINVLDYSKTNSNLFKSTQVPN